MAVIHRATLAPSKLDLLAAWLPTRPWGGAVGALQQLGAYRFDDPAGEVGVETFVVADAAGRVLHVPLTYRAAPLPGVAEGALVGTTEHSVLGTRWVYDGCADPVWVRTVLAAVLAGAPQAEELVEGPDGPVARTPTALVHAIGADRPGSPDLPAPTADLPAPLDDGTVTRVPVGGLVLHLLRVPVPLPAAPHTPADGAAAAPAGPAGATPALVGRWADGPGHLLVTVVG